MEESKLQNLHQNTFDQGDQNEPKSPNSHVEVTDELKTILIGEAQSMHSHFQSFDHEFNNPENEVFYLVSASWLRKWKRYTSYDTVVQGNDDLDEKWFGQVHPGKINEDIVANDPSVSKYPDEDNYRNVMLKGGLQEKIDYELITKAAWDVISDRYENIKVQRPGYILPDGTRYVEVMLKKIKFLPVDYILLKDIDIGRARDLKLFTIQVSAKAKLAKFKEDLAKALNSKPNNEWFDLSDSFFYREPRVLDNFLRLWKLDSNQSLKDFLTYIKEVMSKSASFNFYIDFKGQYLEKDTNITIEDLQIADDDYIFLECRRHSWGWHLNGDGATFMSRCSDCQQLRELLFSCHSCRAAYCTDECKARDEKHHSGSCARLSDKKTTDTSNTARNTGITTQSNNPNPIQNIQNMMGGGFNGFGGFGSQGGLNPYGYNANGISQPYRLQVNISPEEKYKNQLEQIQAMGFNDKQVNLQALQATNGNVEAAIERLLNMY